ncbi:MAG: PP2C family protein-serine/threonine phosphatase [Planctomycetaceae bacterium]
MPDQSQRFELHCMDIWSGYQSVENEVSTPGMDMFVYSEPHLGARRGGDVYYVSLCAGGVITRIILADVSGHGEGISETSGLLRGLMRRYMNSKSQDQLVANLNREFTKLAQAGRFATAIVATYLSHRNRFTICNAGHPLPLKYQAASEKWSWVSASNDKQNPRVANLPLGVDDATDYVQFEVDVADGDLLVLYTDAMTEARGDEDQMLDSAGLLRMASRLKTDRVREFGSELLSSVREFRGNRPAEDDVSLLVLRFVTGRRRTPGVSEKLNAYAKMLGFKPV